MAIKFSIITPTFNSETFISQTIESVISQSGNFSIEYILIDGVSTDNTLNIINKYKSLIESGYYPIQCKKVDINLVSKKDDGMYEAINNGFALATGNVYAWINSDDLYLQGAFNTIAKIFEEYSEISWVKGITSYMNSDSSIYAKGKCFTYYRQWINKGIYGQLLYFIQQDSVFWRKELWNQAGNIDTSLKLAGDYYLWTKFSKYTDLVSVDVLISCFRKRNDQLSSNITSYRVEMDKVCAISRQKKRSFKLFCTLENYFSFIAIPINSTFFLKRNKLYTIHFSNDNKPVLKIHSYQGHKGRLT